jgi:hypothetical protein
MLTSAKSQDNKTAAQRLNEDHVAVVALDIERG